ncbi:MAG TPA: hypothetical protein VNZ52_14070 [Candidatus Thermoplasmatota archaeon]|nr:hypothetical protein [Candidatus Thermoplasmatota archaeon]
MPDEAPSRVAFWSLLALTAALAAGLHLLNASGFPAWSSEESSLFSRALQHEETGEWYSPGFPYREPFGATWFVTLLFDFTGPDWDAARLLAGVLAVGDAVCLYVLATRLSGRPLAGAAAGLAFTLSAPGLVELRRLVLPSFGLFFTLLAAALLVSRIPARVPLAGLAYGLALYTDVYALAAAPAIGLLLYREVGTRPIPLAAFGLLFALFGLLWPFRAALDGEFLEWQEGLRSGMDGPGAEAIARFIGWSPALVLLGLGGLAYLFVKDRARALLPAAWLLGAVAVLFLADPKLKSEALHFAPPFALAAGLFAAHLAVLATERASQALMQSEGATPLGLSGEATLHAAVVAGLVLPMVLGAGGFPTFWSGDANADLRAAADFVAANSDPGDTVVAGSVPKAFIRAEGLKVYDWYRNDLGDKGVRYLVMDDDARYDLRTWPALKDLHDASVPVATFGKYEVREVAR